MKTIAKAVLMLAVLAGCGVDGAPQPPVATGMTISGTLSAGIARDGIASDGG